MGTRTATRVCVCLLSLALLAPTASGSSSEPSAGPSQSASIDTFVERGRERRLAAARQASGCDAAPDAVQCRAFRPASADDEPTYDADRVVVGFSSRSKANAVAVAHSSHVLDAVGHNGAVVLDVPPGTSVPDFLKDLRKNPAVSYAEPNHRVQMLSEPPQTVGWGARAIKAPQAETTNGVTGANVTVAVIDTGVDYRHPDLDDNIFINAAEDHGAPGFQRNERGPGTDNDGVDDDGNGFIDDVIGYDFAGVFPNDSDNDPMDIFAHGTHVAGIVAAEDNSIGVRGVAPDAEIMPLRIFDDAGFGFDSEIANAIYYAVDNGAEIINMSLGGYFPSSVLRDAVEYADANGVSVVAAAGNDFFYSLASYPAAFPSVLSVAAARDADRTTDDEPLSKVWFSDWGHSDFVAPGAEVKSTTPDNTYDTFTGTSMASPHVAGALALVHQALVDNALTPTPAKREQALAAGAVDVHFPGKDEVSGSGAPDTEAATTIVEANHQLELYRDRYLIPSDGATGSTITVRLLEGDGDPIVGEAIAWSADNMGTLSTPVGVTDLNGEASTVLTVDDAYGSAIVTADPASHDPRSIRVIVEDDRVRVDDAFILPPSEEDDFFDPDFPDEGPFPGEEGSIDNAVPQPGQDVVFRVYLGQHDFRSNIDRVSSVEWEVTDPSSAAVPELSGSLDPLTIEPAFFYFENPFFESELMSVPSGAEPGRYHLTVTATMDATGDTHTFEKDFFIGIDSAEVLIVNHTFSMDTETLNLFVFHQNDSAVRRAVEPTGRTFTLWDPDVHGFLTLDVLKAHPVVIYLGGWEDTLEFDIDLLQAYVASGGNLLVSGEQFATFARFTSASTPYRNMLNASGLLTTLFPDDNHQQYPPSVTFGDTGFDALDPLTGTYDLGAYDLNHTGESTAIFADELKLFNNFGAETLGTYPTGINGPDFEAATVLEDADSRVIDLGFGLESINDDTTTLADALDAILAFFEPPLDVTAISPRRVNNSGKKSFRIEGVGFQGTGSTEVKIGSRVMPARRVTYRDHTLLSVRVPARFRPGRYDVTVTNPDGQSDTIVKGVRIVPASN